MKYYIPVNNAPSGPYSIEELKLMHLTPETLVWHDKLPQWVRAGEIDELRVALFGQSPVNPYGDGTTPPPPDPTYTQNTYQHHPYSSWQQTGQPTGQQQQTTMPPCPPNYLVQAILLTICCCLPAGIVAIVYSSKIDTAYRMGRYDEALQASSNARLWCIIGLVAGIAVNIFWAVYSAIVSAPLFANPDIWNI